MKLSVILLVGSFLLSGCGASLDKLVKRAEFDLDCPQNALEVIDLGELTKGVKGCGKRATYVESCNHPSRASQSCKWILNTSLEEK